MIGDHLAFEAREHGRDFFKRGLDGLTFRRIGIIKLPRIIARCIGLEMAGDGHMFETGFQTADFLF